MLSKKLDNKRVINSSLTSLERDNEALKIFKYLYPQIPLREEPLKQIMDKLTLNQEMIKLDQIEQDHNKFYELKPQDQMLKQQIRLA